MKSFVIQMTPGSHCKIPVAPGYEVKVLDHVDFLTTLHVRLQYIPSSNPRHAIGREDYLNSDLTIHVGYPRSCAPKNIPLPDRDFVPGEVFLLQLLTRYVWFAKELLKFEKIHETRINEIQGLLKASKHISTPDHIIDLRARVDELKAMTASLMIHQKCNFTAHLVGPPGGSDPMILLSLVTPTNPATIRRLHHVRGIKND